MLSFSININFGFTLVLPLHRCVLALYTMYFPKLWEKKSQAFH